MNLVYAKRELTCDALEAELGLSPGDVAGLTLHPDGAIEIQTAKALTETQKLAFRGLLGLTEKE